MVRERMPRASLLAGIAVLAAGAACSDVAPRAGQDASPPPRTVRAPAGGLYAGTTEVSLSLFLPETLLGSTLTWNPDTGAYEPDPSRRDGPPSGVRLVMYEVDLETRTPALPLTEIGHVDLIDETPDRSGLRLRVRVVDTSGAEPEVLAEYVIRSEDAPGPLRTA